MWRHTPAMRVLLLLIPLLLLPPSPTWSQEGALISDDDSAVGDGERAPAPLPSSTDTPGAGVSSVDGLAATAGDVSAPPAERVFALVALVSIACAAVYQALKRWAETWGLNDSMPTWVHRAGSGAVALVASLALLHGYGMDTSDPALLLSAAGPLVAWLTHGGAKVVLNGLPPPKGRLP